MTDRELIELAAKAAGIELCVWGTKGAENFAVMPRGERWNPLESDADAFRLAVKLRLLVDVNESSTDAADGDIRHEAFEVQHGSDPYAATRRAITMAAAKIAKERTS